MLPVCILAGAMGGGRRACFHPSCYCVSPTPQIVFFGVFLLTIGGSRSAEPDEAEEDADCLAAKSLPTPGSGGPMGHLGGPLGRTSPGGASPGAMSVYDNAVYSARGGGGDDTSTADQYGGGHGQPHPGLMGMGQPSKLSLGQTLRFTSKRG